MVDPLLLAHRHPDSYDRCMVVAGRHVCRRCLILYPTLLIVAFVTALAGFDAPWWAIWLPPVPATIEFWAEMNSKVSYSVFRASLFNVFMAIGVGLGLSFFLDDQTAAEFWGPVAVYVIVWAVITVTSKKGPVS